MSEPSPIVYQGTPDIHGFNITWASNTTVVVSAGTLLDNTLVNTFSTSVPTTLNISVTGINALDDGTVAASTVYAVYLISSYLGNKPTGFIISKLPVPIFPAGYDMFRRVGWVVTDGSSHIINITQTGSDSVRVYAYDPAVSVLSGGVSNVPQTPVDLSMAVPPIVTKVLFSASYGGDSVGNGANMQPLGSTNASYITMAVQQVVTNVFSQVTCMTGVVGGAAGVSYQCGAGAGLSLDVLSFEDYL
jgi:hypothetical protein